MATINDPNTAANVTKVGPVDTSAGDMATHVDVRSPAFGALGQYMAFGESGSIAAGALTNGELFQLRYTGGSIVLVHAIILEYVVVTTAFAAGELSYNVIKATGWSVDGTGGGLQTPEKLRTSMAAPTATFRVPTTAALGAGTKTLATNPIRKIRGNALSGAASAGGIPMHGFTTSAAVTSGFATGIPLYPSPAPADNIVYPICLVANEGVVVRITQPATGVAIHGITIRFTETTAY
jgi:hypothetical protein